MTEQTGIQPKGPEDDGEAYGLMDTLDEELIRADLGGVLTDELLYEFEFGEPPRKVTGLTVFGAIAMARLAVQRDKNLNILCDKPIVEEREDSFKASVKVTFTGPFQNRLEIWGTKSQKKELRKRDGTIKRDENAEQIAEMKALRNGILKIFPPKTSAEFIKELLKEGKNIKRLSPEEVSRAVEQAKIVGKGQAEESTPASSPNPNLGNVTHSPKIDKISSPSVVATELRKAVNSLRWVARDGKTTRYFQPGDAEGYAKVRDHNDITFEGAMRILEELEQHEGRKFMLDSEVYEEDEEGGHLLRSVVVE